MAVGYDSERHHSESSDDTEMGKEPAGHREYYRQGCQDRRRRELYRSQCSGRARHSDGHTYRVPSPRGLLAPRGPISIRG